MGNRTWLVMAVVWLFTFAIGASPAMAVDYSWNNAAGGSWSMPTNWMPNGVPNAVNDRVTVLLPGTYTITLSSSVSIDRFLNFGLGASHPTLVINSGANLTFNSGTSVIGSEGSITLSGSDVIPARITLNGVSVLQNQGILRARG